ncbi:MAG: substrate-binding domain-containing protein, partial [Gemmataceae bacterium]
WTDYLGKVSANFAEKIKRGNQVSWPVGQEAKGNDGVANLVSQTKGAIGYSELTYALANNLSYGAIKKPGGAVVLPSLASVSAAADRATIPPDLRFTLTDIPGEDAYPVSGTTWAVVWRSPTRPIKPEVIEFLKWATTTGQPLATDLRYAPLPRSLAARAGQHWNTP